ERVARILRANEMGERHGDALGRSEAVFAVENHAMRTIEHDDGGTRGLVFALVDHEVLVADVDGDCGTVAANGVEESFADVEIKGVAEFVLAGDAASFDTGGEVASVVAAEAAAAEGTEKIAQRFEAEEVDGLVGDFKASFGVALHRRADGAA